MTAPASGVDPSSHTRPQTARPALRTARPLLLRLLSTGHPVAPILADCGIDPTALSDADARVEYGKLIALWRHAEAIDALVGLRAAEVVDLRVIDVAQLRDYIGLRIFAASPTLGQGLARYARAFGINNGPCAVTWSRGEGKLRLFVPTQPPPVQAYNDYLLAASVRAMLGFSSTALRSLRVELTRAEAHADDYARLFGAEVRFGAKQDAIVVGEHELDTTLRTAASAGQLRALEREVCEQERAESDFAAEVRNLVASMLGSGTISIEQVSARLDMSARTLARHLKTSGTTYQRIVDEMRARRAREYLLEGTLPIQDIAALLAFSEVSAFHRAFRRWFGEAPSTFRQRNV